MQWLLATLSFVRSTEPYAAWWSGQRGALLLIHTTPLFGLAWLSLLVWLNRRVASGRQPALD